MLCSWNVLVACTLDPLAGRGAPCRAPLQAAAQDVGKGGICQEAALSVSVSVCGLDEHDGLAAEGTSRQGGGGQARPFLGEQQSMSAYFTRVNAQTRL
jgi:hypothetical protein